MQAAWRVSLSSACHRTKFPASTFIGVDYHDESIRKATAAAEAAWVSARGRFEVGDASSYSGTYDPVGAPAHARSLLPEDGRVFAVKPFAHVNLEDALDNPAAALGAQAGPARLTAAFADAGLSTARVAAETPFDLLIEATV